MGVAIMHHRRRLSRFSVGIFCFAGLWCLTAVPVAAAGDDDFFTHLHTEKAMANVTVSPGRAGPVNITIQLETMEEKPLTAKAVSVTLSDAKAGKRLQTVAAEHVSGDRWRVRIPDLAAGRWMLSLGISISDADRFSVESPILIK
jgi:hypothetical protein